MLQSHKQFCEFFGIQPDIPDFQLELAVTAPCAFFCVAEGAVGRHSGGRKSFEIGPVYCSIIGQQSAPPGKK
jgi:hypothetical protein